MSVVLNLGVVIGVAIKQPNSVRKLGLELAALHHAGEPVLMLGEFHYDLPIYARLQAPVTVVDDWPRWNARPRDNWRKELSDAGRFAPDLARSTLLIPDAMSSLLCSAKTGWVIGHTDAPGTYPVLAFATVVAKQRDIRLWRVDSSQPDVFEALQCAGTTSLG